MSSPFPTRRAMLVSGAALAVHSALGLPTRLHDAPADGPSADMHDMSEIINKYIAAELALPAHSGDGCDAPEDPVPPCPGPGARVEVQHAIDSVGSLGFRDTALIAVRLIMGVEDILRRRDTHRSPGHDADNRRPPGPPPPTDRCTRCAGSAVPALSCGRGTGDTDVHQAPFAAPPLHNLLQTLPGQGSHGVVDGNS